VGYLQATGHRPQLAIRGWIPRRQSTASLTVDHFCPRRRCSTAHPSPLFHPSPQARGPTTACTAILALVSSAAGQESCCPAPAEAPRTDLARRPRHAAHCGLMELASWTLWAVLLGNWSSRCCCPTNRPCRKGGIKNRGRTPSWSRSVRKAVVGCPKASRRGDKRCIYGRMPSRRQLPTSLLTTSSTAPQPCMSKVWTARASLALPPLPTPECAQVCLHLLELASPELVGSAYAQHKIFPRPPLFHNATL
jgi:hypothetical protein